MEFYISSALGYYTNECYVGMATCFASHSKTFDFYIAGLLSQGERKETAGNLFVVRNLPNLSPGKDFL